MQPRLVLLACVMVVATACSAAPAPSTSPLPQPTQSPASPAPAPTANQQAIKPDQPSCPPRPFDPAASLGPEFEQDIFVRDESKAIAAEFLAGLAGFYADPSADPCRHFTDRGWATALAHVPRLRAVARGEAIVVQDHLPRVTSEGVYDLRDRPLVVPLDIIFDVPAGAATTDLASGETTTTTSVSREGFHADFQFDGHRWRVDRMGPLEHEYRDWLALPWSPPPGPACPVLTRDPDGAPFDVGVDRQWCDGDGRSIARNQLRLWTQYPCDRGRAAILDIGRPLGMTRDPLVPWQYVRDPADEFFDLHWVAERYDGDATLPDDAVDSGWTNGNIDLWVSPSALDRAVYVVRGERVERWPRANEWWGVIDCN